jgi:formylglycine-generating enzyme required for sulfatase activity
LCSPSIAWQTDDVRMIGALGVWLLATVGCGGRSGILEPADGPRSLADIGRRDGAGRHDAIDRGSPTWIVIQPGTFVMGSPDTEKCRDAYDEDYHQVTLTHRFEISSTEVTRAQFAALMGYSPSALTGCGADCPVESVSWHQAASYCNTLSASRGLAPCYICSGSGKDTDCTTVATYYDHHIYECRGYRLPMEAEWEYAYRAGTKGPFYLGTITSCIESDAGADAIGWYLGNAGKTPHPVARKAPNAWGLYDMAGNVGEWCHDWYSPGLGTYPVIDPWGAGIATKRAIRFGAWASEPRTLRAASRSSLPSTDRSTLNGVRCVRTL